MNRAIRLDPDAARRFADMRDKVILLELVGDGAPVQIYVLPSLEGIHFRQQHEVVPDVVISGTPGIFLNQLLRGPTVSDALTIRGDIGLGQKFQYALSRFAPDWEEGMAQIIGDVPAHQFARLARGFFSWGKEAVRTFGIDGAEYLKEEAFVLAKRDRIENFLRDVDKLRADADRLEKRIERLAETL